MKPGFLDILFRLRSQDVKDYYYTLMSKKKSKKKLFFCGAGDFSFVIVCPTIKLDIDSILFSK